jgi:hypothetical protein
MKSLLESASVESTALYFSLSVGVVRHWESYFDIENQVEYSQDTNDNQIHATVVRYILHGLQVSVRGLINQIFDQLAKDYRVLLTRFAVGLITFSRSGISDLAMQDLLSMNDDVLHEVFQYSQPATYYRFPLHVWLRLRDAMRGLIVLRSYNCWNWYHRQLSETLIYRYSREEKTTIHQTIGLYMSNVVPQEMVLKRLISKQPLPLTPVQIWFHNAVLNERRFIERFYHLVHGDLITEAVKEITSFEVICGGALINQGYDIVQCIQLLYSKIRTASKQQESLGAVEVTDECGECWSIMFYLKTILSSIFCSIKEEPQDTIYHYFRWLYQDMTFISRSPRMFIPVAASSQPKVSKVRADINEYVKTTRSDKEHDNFDKHVWFNGLTLGGYADHSPSLASLQGHSRDETVKIWDATIGACLNTLEDHSSSVTSVCMSINLQMSNSTRDGLGAAYGFSSSSSLGSQGVLGVCADKFLNIGRTSKLQLVLQTTGTTPISVKTGTVTKAATFKVTLSDFTLQCAYVDIGARALAMLDQSLVDGKSYIHGLTYRTSTNTLPSTSDAISLLAGLRGSSVKSLFARFQDNALTTAGSINGKYDSKMPMCSQLGFNIGGSRYPPIPIPALLQAALCFRELQSAVGSFNSTDYSFASPTLAYCKLSAGGTAQGLGITSQDYNWSLASDPVTQALFIFGTNTEVGARRGVLSGLNCNATPIFVEMTIATAPTNSHNVFVIAQLDQILFS